MELLQYINIIRKWIWLIILATTLAAGSSLIASTLAVPVYQTTTTLIVSQIINNPNPSGNEILASQQTTSREVILNTLAGINVENYLLSGGLSQSDLNTLRTRLLTTAH